MLLSPYLQVRGWSFQESPAGTPRAPAGTIYRPKGSQDFTPTWGQAALPDARSLDEYMISYPSWPGVKNFSAALLAMVHEATHTELAPLFKCALGKRSSTAVLTIKPAGAHTNGTIEMNDANIPAPIIQIVGSDAKIYERPIKDFDAGTKIITLAIKLPAGVLPVTVKNPVTATGDCWQESLDAPATFRVELDQRGQTNETKGLADVCVPSELSLRFDVQGRLAFGVGWSGAEWTLGAAPNVQAQGKQGEQFLAYNSTCFINDLTAPAVPNKVPLNGFALDLAPEWLPILGQTGVDGNDADPESNLIQWDRGKALMKGLGLNFASTLGSQRYTDRATMVNKGCFLRFKSRVAGSGNPTRVLSIWYPEITPDNNPTKGANGGIEAETQPFVVGQSTLLSANVLTKCAVAITQYA